MPDFFLDIYQLRIIFALLMLSIGSTLDLWKRTVHDSLWIAFGVIAIVLVFLEPSFSDAIVEFGISLIIIPIALIGWRLGVFGGADAFCLIVLSALASHVTFSDSFVTPITTLTNAALLSIVTIFVNLTRNGIAILNHKNIFEGFTETKLRKTCAMFLGYKANKPKFSFSIERIEGSNKKLDFSIHHAEHEDFCKTPNTWVSPGIPFLVYIAGGFILQLLFGDIILNSLTSLYV